VVSGAGDFVGTEKVYLCCGYMGGRVYFCVNVLEKAIVLGHWV
jgi:hypothetical protein